MGKNLMYFFIAIPVLILVDIFARFLFLKSWFSNIELSNEVDPVSVLSILVSAVVAIWLGWYITRKLSAQRFQKEYLITDIKKIEEEIISIENRMQVSSIELQDILTLLNKFRLYIDRFSKTIDIFQITSINSQQLSADYYRLYTKTTDTEGDSFALDESLKIEISSICSSIIAETRQMIFIINKE